MAAPANSQVRAPTMQKPPRHRRAPRLGTAPAAAAVATHRTAQRRPNRPLASASIQDLTIFVQSLLEQMQSRFTQMSDQVRGVVGWWRSRVTCFHPPRSATPPPPLSKLPTPHRTALRTARPDHWPDRRDGRAYR